MSNVPIKLKDKTIVLAGPLTSLYHNIALSLSEYGADIAFVNRDTKIASKFAENINNNREIHQNFGRAVAIESELNTLESVNDTMGKVAEFLGGIDVIIDNHFCDFNFDFNNDESLNLFTEYSQIFTEGALPFLIGRKKGRFIYLTYSDFFDSNINIKMNDRIDQIISSHNHHTIGTKVSVNRINMGPTEDFLLSKYPNNKSLKEAIIEYQKELPQAKIIESSDISNVVAFLASPLSQGINGQNINVNYGITK